MVMNNMEKTTKDYSLDFNKLYSEEPEVLMVSLELPQSETSKETEYAFKTDVAIHSIFITAHNASDPQYASGWSVLEETANDEIINDCVETRKILSKGFVMGQSSANIYIPFPKPILIYKNKSIIFGLYSNQFNRYSALKVLLYFTRVFK
jgi:hypothetical protein